MYHLSCWQNCKMLISQFHHPYWGATGDFYTTQPTTVPIITFNPPLLHHSPFDYHESDTTKGFDPPPLTLPYTTIALGGSLDGPLFDRNFRFIVLPAKQSCLAFRLLFTFSQCRVRTELRYLFYKLASLNALGKETGIFLVRICFQQYSTWVWNGSVLWRNGWVIIDSQLIYWFCLQISTTNCYEYETLEDFYEVVSLVINKNESCFHWFNWSILFNTLIKMKLKNIASGLS